MDKKKILIIGSVFLCVMLFLVEWFMIGMDAGDEERITQIKSTFQKDILELKNGKYENLTATDFEASIENVESVYNLQILYPEGYADISFWDNMSLLAESGMEENTLEFLWNPNYKNQRLQKNFERVNQMIDQFFMAEVDKSNLTVAYWKTSEEKKEVEYNEFKNSLSEGLSTLRSLYGLFGNTIKEGGHMIQIDSYLNGAWFSRGELGSIMPSWNEIKTSYTYSGSIRSGEDIGLHLLDGDILLSELEEKAMEYLNGNEFPFPKTKGIDYVIGQVHIIENADDKQYDGVCFIVRRIYKGVPFDYGIWGTLYDCDTSEISYARSDVPDTIRDFDGLDGEVVEMPVAGRVLSAGEAIKVLSEYFGNQNGIYEIRGVELVYKNCDIPKDNRFEISDLLEPYWRFIVCPGGSGNEIIYFVNAVTGEVK